MSSNSRNGRGVPTSSGNMSRGTNSGKVSNGIKSTGKKAMSSYQSSSTGTKVFVWIVIALIIILLIWWIVYAIRKGREHSNMNPVIIDSPIDSWVKRPTVKVPMPSSGYNLSYSMWIYIRDWDYRFGKWKNLMWKGNTSKPVHSPSIWFYPLTNSMKVVTSTNGSNGMSSCDVQNIPLQKWVHIVYVLNNRSVDIYVNGKLERTCILDGIPINNKNDKLTINHNGGFYGKMGRFQYFTRSLNPEDVVSLYTRGPEGSSAVSINMFNNGQIKETDRQDNSNE